MVVLNDLGHLATGPGFRGVDDDCRVVVAVNLAAFDLLKPAVLGNSRHRDALCRVGIQHREENAAKCGRVDVVVEEANMGIIRLRDIG